MDEKKDLLDVFFIEGEYTTCPRCNKTMNLLETTYCAYTISSGGWITSKIGNQHVLKCVCTECGFIRDMDIDEDGLFPKGMERSSSSERLLIPNPICKKM